LEDVLQDLKGRSDKTVEEMEREFDDDESDVQEIDDGVVGRHVARMHGYERETMRA